MTSTALPEQHPWPLWRKIIFRFFFIFLAFLMAPWTWLDPIPYINKLTTFFTRYYNRAMDWAVEISNANFFHVRKVLVLPNGSGDTSWAWAQLWMLLCLSFIGCVIWSIADRKRNDYRHLNYWLCLFCPILYCVDGVCIRNNKIICNADALPERKHDGNTLG